MGIEDQLAVMRAEGDQARAAATDMAQTLGAFRKQLICEGFDGQTATEMADTLFSAMLGNYENATEGPSEATGDAE